MAAHEHTGSCKEVFAMLSAYLDLELPVDDCRAIEEHLAGCPPCIEFANSLRKTVELCRGYQPNELPAPVETKARDELLAAYHRMLEARGGGSKP